MSRVRSLWKTETMHIFDFQIFLFPHLFVTCLFLCLLLLLLMHNCILLNGKEEKLYLVDLLYKYWYHPSQNPYLIYSAVKITIFIEKTIRDTQLQLASLLLRLTWALSDIQAVASVYLCLLF